MHKCIVCEVPIRVGNTKMLCMLVCSTCKHVVLLLRRARMKRQSLGLLANNNNLNKIAIEKLKERYINGC